MDTILNVILVISVTIPLAFDGVSELSTGYKRPRRP